MIDAPDDCERAQEAYLAAGVSDGLPVVPATPERVERMLRASGCDPAAVIATLAPMQGEATWRDVAREAVLAGCRPDYLPVVGAAVAAVADDAFNLLGLQTTTGSASTLLIVNGPIVSAIGMNAAGNALGPGNRANATIGRALRLVLQNIGGARAGETDMATLGQPGKYTFCMAENEAASPWPALHVERGFAADDSVVTVVGASGIVEIADTASVHALDLITTYAASTVIAGTVGGAGILGGGEPLLIVPPEHAALFARDGYGKSEVKTAIFERATLPLERLSPAVRAHIARAAGAPAAAATDAASNAANDAANDVGVLRIARRAEDIMLVVAGGVGVKAAYVPTWTGGTRAVSRMVPRSPVR